MNRDIFIKNLTGDQIEMSPTVVLEPHQAEWELEGRRPS